jgi:hypothetical protein
MNLPCQAAQQLVSSRAAAVLGTSGYTYDRFVRDRSFCEVSESSASRSSPLCAGPRHPQGFVGVRCGDGPHDLFWGD